MKYRIFLLFALITLIACGQTTKHKKVKISEIQEFTVPDSLVTIDGTNTLRMTRISDFATKITTSKITVSDPTTESISGDSTTQQEINQENNIELEKKSDRADLELNVLTDTDDKPNGGNALPFLAPDAILNYAPISTDVSLASFIRYEKIEPDQIYSFANGYNQFITYPTFTLFGTDFTRTSDTKITVNTTKNIGVYTGNSFSVATEDTSPHGMSVVNNGTKMYVIGFSSSSVHEYDLITPFDVSTAVYTTNSFIVSSQDAIPRDIYVLDNGTKMYMIGNITDSVYEYDLITPFDVSTAVYTTNSFSIAAEDTLPTGVNIINNGTKMYMIGDDTNSVYEYDLITPFDVSTAVYTTNSFFIGTEDPSPDGLAITSDGTKMFIVGSQNDFVHKYNFITPFDVSTAVYTTNSFSVAAEDSSSNGLAITSDETKIYMIGTTTDSVYEYDLGGGYDIKVELLTRAINTSVTFPADVTLTIEKNAVPILGATDFISLTDADEKSLTITLTDQFIDAGDIIETRLVINNNGNNSAVVHIIGSGSNIFEIGDPIGLIIPIIPNDYLEFPSQWEANGNDIFNKNSANVGIGTTTPLSLLNIEENTTGTGINNGLTISQSGTGDALQHFTLTGGQSYTMGIDNSASDGFKIGTGTDLNTPVFQISASGNPKFFNTLVLDDGMFINIDGSDLAKIETDGGVLVEYDDGAAFMFFADRALASDNFVLEAPKMTIAQINSGSARILITKEAADARYSPVAAHGGLGVEANATGTVIASAGTYVKIAGTTSQTVMDDVTHSNNRLTYTGTETRHFTGIAFASFISSVSNDIISFKFAKNGTVIGFPATTKIGTGTDIRSVTILFDFNLSTNDFIELFVTDEDNASTITIEDLYMSIEGD